MAKIKRQNRFLRIGNDFYAIDYSLQIVYHCRNSDNDLMAGIELGQQHIDNVESNETAFVIDAAFFVSKFSSVVAKLHSQTPYA